MYCMYLTVRSLAGDADSQSDSPANQMTHLVRAHTNFFQMELGTIPLRLEKKQPVVQLDGDS